MGDEPFAILLADDMIRNDGAGALAQMIEVHRQTGASVIGVEEVPEALTSSYGIVGARENAAGLHGDRDHRRKTPARGGAVPARRDRPLRTGSLHLCLPA